MALPPVVALEIGTSKVVALVGELREDGHVMITGMGEQASLGVRKGDIIDLENAASCVRAVLAMAEESGKVAIRQVLLAISGGHIQSSVNRGTVPVLDEDGEITRDDIEEVMEVARAVNLPPEREIIHTVCQHFCIDEQECVMKPEGMEGARLSVDMLVLHGLRRRLHNTVRVVHNIPLDVQDVAFSGLCSALAVLTPEQKKSGAIVIDLGGGTTDYLVYAGNVVAAAGALGVGGDHLTNDIALGFSIPPTQAERLKKESGCVTLDKSGAFQRVSLPAELGFPGRSVSLKSLHMVMHARMDEIFGMIRKRLDDSRILHHVGAGVILTGGGSGLRGATELAEQIFDLPCSVGKPRGVSGLASAINEPRYATCAGLVQYGIKTAGDTQSGSLLGSLLRGLFRR